MSAKKLAITIGLALLCASCGRQSPSPFVAQRSPAATRAGAANDYTKPYLTEDKMQKFLNSMQEGKNPFDFLFGQAGKGADLTSLPRAVEELNAFARKYGFQDYEDYTAVWGRIMAGEAQMMADDMMKGMREGMQKTIQDAQAQLNKPDLTPEMRQMYQEQLTSAQKSLDDMNKSSDKPALNDADMQLVRKFKDQIDAAEKKYQTAK